MRSVISGVMQAGVGSRGRRPHVGGINVSVVFVVVSDVEFVEVK